MVSCVLAARRRRRLGPTRGVAVGFRRRMNQAVPLAALAGGPALLRPTDAAAQSTQSPPPAGAPAPSPPPAPSAAPAPTPTAAPRAATAPATTSPTIADPAVVLRAPNIAQSERDEA